MSMNYTKWVLVTCVLLGVFGCVSVPKINLGRSGPESLPVEQVVINIDIDQREELFTQLRDFADKYSAKFTLSFYDADKKSFLIVIYGNGFSVKAIDVTNSPQEIKIYFYNESPASISQARVEELFNDLRSFIGGIPNVIITEVETPTP